MNPSLIPDFVVLLVPKISRQRIRDSPGYPLRKPDTHQGTKASDVFASHMVLCRVQPALCRLRFFYFLTLVVSMAVSP